MIKREIKRYELSLEDGDICQFYTGEDVRYMIVIGNNLIGSHSWDALEYFDSGLNNVVCYDRSIQAVFRLTKEADIYSLEDLVTLITDESKLKKATKVVWTRGE